MSLNPDQELNEICLTQADLDRMTAEFNLAVTQALELNPPPATQPMGVLIPFPARPVELESRPPTRRELREVRRTRLTGRAWALLGVLGGAASAVAAGAIW